MNLTVTQFQPEHLQFIDPCQMDMAPDRVDDNLDWTVLSRTFYANDRPVAMAGIIEKWSRVGRAWAWLSEECRENHIWSFTKHIKRYLLPAADAHFVRIDAEVRADWPEGISYAEMLGFHEEARMRRYGIGGEGDYLLFARFRDGG